MESFFTGLEDRDILDCVNVMIVSDHGGSLMKFALYSTTSCHCASLFKPSVVICKGMFIKHVWG